MKTLKDILTARQFTIANLISEGFTNEEIARQIKISLQGVKNHNRHMYEKTGCSRADREQMVPRVELATRFAIEAERGLYGPPSGQGMDYRCDICGEVLERGPEDATTIHFKPCTHSALAPEKSELSDELKKVPEGVRYIDAPNFPRIQELLRLQMPYVSRVD